MKFSANLGFLWTELPLPDAIRTAKAAGFDAVECHWPYDTPADDVKSALKDTGLTMLGLNTVRGDVAAGDNGLAAIPGREAEAKAAIDQAIAYARAIDCRAVHVMAGFSGGPRARDTFAGNLTYACQQAPDLTMLIEPLNHYDAPGYALHTPEDAASLIHELKLPNLKLMFDCYHCQIMGGDVLRRFIRFRDIIGHVQIAAVPDRAAPDHGELDYRWLLPQLGWDMPIGAEYKPGGPTGDTLGWMQAYR